MKFNKKNLRDVDYLEHIMNACNRIIDKTKDLDIDRFLDDEDLPDIVTRQIEKIGEASNNIARNCPDFVERFPDFNLAGAYNMRNRIIHGYFSVDMKLVWAVARDNIPELATNTKKAYLDIVQDALSRPLGDALQQSKKEKPKL